MGPERTVFVKATGMFDIYCEIYRNQRSELLLGRFPSVNQNETAAEKPTHSNDFLPY
jgi:hypothetical protein